jgi:hypothetical protein
LCSPITAMGKGAKPIQPSCKNTSQSRMPSKRLTCKKSRWWACQKMAMTVKLLR